MELFHGTRIAFNRFDPQYYRSGEGGGYYKGWYFCKGAKGALSHCESYLRCDVFSGEGVILRCLADDNYVDIEGPLTEPLYGRPVYGVCLTKSPEILVLEVLPAKTVFESIYGQISI